MQEKIIIFRILMSCQKYYCQKYYGDLNLHYNSKHTNGKGKMLKVMEVCRWVGVMEYCIVEMHCILNCVQTKV